MIKAQNDGSEVVVSIHEDFWISAQYEKEFRAEFEELMSRYRI